MSRNSRLTVQSNESYITYVYARLPMATIKLFIPHSKKRSKRIRIVHIIPLPRLS